MIHSGVDLVRRFLNQWPGLSPAEIADFFHKDATYQHLGSEVTLTGAHRIAGAIEIYRARFEQIECRIVWIAQQDEAVLLERVDELWLPGERKVEIPAMSVVMVSQAKIARARDYLDTAALRAQVGLTEA